MFKVSTKEGVVNLNEEQLVELLLAQALKSERANASATPQLADALTKLLETQSLLRTMSLRELVTIAIDTGYYLNIFFRKNDVEIEEECKSNR